MKHLEKLFIEELSDIHNAETQLIKALPKMQKPHSRKNCGPPLRNTSNRQRNRSGDSTRFSNPSANR